MKLTTKQILEENLAREAPKALQSLKILVHNIRSLHNVGAIFRSADAFGISEVILSGHSPTPPRPEINKTAIGAEEFMDWRYEESGLNAILGLKEEGYHIIGLEQTEESIPLPELEIPSTKKTCIVLGSEVSGIDDELLAEIDIFTAIPQFGYKHSLNVSVAAGVMLYAVLVKSWKG
ncbi:RNA methyltransferase [Gracilimonas mengyeensis]|uniref:SpoU rRNA Methylase family protein n=1 Tax=Gracilimonas mengyeensis TaxID=1302730 RepID=A0A521ASH6_9BACT|nr:RNA methyltransferase [Gracilimonas mengyeensis]SMO37600.1 SpoU rRNA Methylase family protein [Gracilimonas mengyeensis]